MVKRNPAIRTWWPSYENWWKSNQQMWHKSLYDALWADRITPKRSLGMSPFQVLYGIDAELPISAELPALRLARAIEDETFQSSLEKRIMYLAELEEKRVK
ncbi:hypothetical protein KI387_024372, partial [Taxus chinensis]